MKALEKKIEEIRINAANRESILTGENRSGLLLNSNYKQGFMEGWKEALEWVLQKEHIAKLNEGEKFVFTDFIEKELGQ